MALVEARNLEKTFTLRRGKKLPVLRNVSLSIKEGETLCVVGESGCGKTTLGRLLAGLEEPDGGTYVYNGKKTDSLSKTEQKQFRRDVQMIHQNPYESLNPALMIYHMIAPVLRRQRQLKGEALTGEAMRLLRDVGLSPEADFLGKYPAFLSGGQRQRASIARILSVNPRFIVIDEATSMVDSSLRIALLETLREIQKKYRAAYFFITHDLALGRYFASGHRLMVMYLGQVLETAPTEEAVRRPLHPYTRAILSAARSSLVHKSPIPAEKYSLLNVDIPSFAAIPPGCSLSPRCPERIKGLCGSRTPELTEYEPGRWVRCHLYQKQGKP